MKKDSSVMFPVDPRQIAQEPPIFVLGQRYFATLRPGSGTHLHVSWVEGYRLVYQLLGSHPIPSAASTSHPVSRQRFGVPSETRELQLHRLLLSVTDPEGEHVRAPQVVFTLVGSDGVHRMTPGLPCSAGHSLIFEWGNPHGLRVETEVVANGRFITDHFVLEISGLLN